MARTVRDAELGTREARGRLKARGKPYYRTLDPRLHLGYRKPRSGAGKWVVRHYAGEQAYEVETIATADDLSDATFKDRDIPAANVKPTDVLSFAQAQTKARAIRDGRSQTSAGISGPMTVADAMADYIAYLEREKKTADDARYRDEAFIAPAFASTLVTDLKSKPIRDWHLELSKTPPRLRTKKDRPQNFRKLGNDAETIRQRKVSANRTLAILKAALNRAWREHPKQVPSNAEWHRVAPFKRVDSARIRYLSVAEAQRLLNACDPNFRQLVQAALETGARYGELTRLTVADFHPDSGTIAIRQSKGGKPRHVVLTDQGQAFFRQICAGRVGSEPMLVRSAGGTWGRSHQDRFMREAVARARISPRISFHGLRHTWASLAIMNGTPLMVVSRNLGHVDTKMVEKHYGHLAPSYIAEAIRAGAPRFGFKPDKKIAELGA
jgi:integrase